MDNNVTKNTFSYKLLESEFFQGNLSLKRLIQRELITALSLYQRQNTEVNNWQQITTSLWSKITLCYEKKLSWQLSYRCAIAFPLANSVNLSPLAVARDLVTLLLSLPKKAGVFESLSMEISIVKSGWIDFSFCDRNIAIWLDRLVRNITLGTNYQLLYCLANKSERSGNLFPLQYIYNRCDSLLNLGEKEGVIVLQSKDRTYLQWRIKQPSPLKWQDSQGNLCLSCPQERDLLWQICLMMDYLAESKQYNPAHWKQFTIEISRVWSSFIARCRFCGEVKTQNPTLAIARLGLIAINHWCLEALLISKLNILPQREI